MSHRDPRSRNPFSASAQDLRKVIEWLVGAADFRALPSPKDGRWSFRGLVVMALLWVWSEEATLTGRFAAVLPIARALWPQELRSAISYQAFLKRLMRWTVALLVPLQQLLRQQMQQALTA